MTHFVPTMTDEEIAQWEQKLRAGTLFSTESEHGKRATYQYRRCRCLPCKNAQAEYVKAYRARTGA